MEIGTVVMINLPHFAGNAVDKVKSHRQFNHRVAKITAVEGDAYRLNIDGGKNRWPESVLAIPIIK